MKRHGGIAQSCLLVGFVTLLAGTAVAQTAPVFHATELPSIVEGLPCLARAINDAGVVAGQCGDQSLDFTAVVWRNGSPTVLGKLVGGIYADATAINSLGTIVGDGDMGDYQPRAWVTYNGGLLSLDSQGGANIRSIGITDSGVIFGNLAKGLSGNTKSWNPVFWTQEPGKPDRYRRTTLPKYPGGDSKANTAYLLGSNKAGQAVGWVTTSLIGQLGGFWNNDAAHSVVSLAALPGGSFSIATAINDVGQAVGFSNLPGAVDHAVLWQNDADHTPVDLGTLPGHEESRATAVNAAGQVVGMSSSSTPVPETRAYFWQNGAMYDLLSLIDPADRVATIESVWAINNPGQIVVVGTIDGRSGPLVLTPLP